MTRSPESVFTPGQPPSKDMFEKRNAPDELGNPGIQDQIANALRTPGFHVLLHGDSGVGKTSLLALAAEQLKLKMIDVGCYEGDTFDNLIDRALGAMVEVKEITRSESREGSGSIEGVAGASSFLNIRAKIERRWLRAKSFELLQVEPATALVAAMRKSGTHVIQFDNFHNVGDDATRRVLAQTMERVSGMAATSKPESIAIVGIASDAIKLLGGTVAYTRRTKQIPVPRMTDAEIRSILRAGFELLDIAIDADLIEKLTFMSDGFPYYAHSLGLHVSRALRQAPGLTNEEVMARTIALAAAEVDASYSDRLAIAMESSRAQVQPRTRILRFLADSEKRSMTGAEIVTAWEQRYESKSNYSFLWAALGVLALDRGGLMLTRTGSSGKFKYAFSDPHLRPFLRMKFQDDSST